MGSLHTLVFMCTYIKFLVNGYSIYWPITQTLKSVHGTSGMASICSIVLWVTHLHLNLFGHTDLGFQISYSPKPTWQMHVFFMIEVVQVTAEKDIKQTHGSTSSRSPNKDNRWLLVGGNCEMTFHPKLQLEWT